MFPRAGCTISPQTPGGNVSREGKYPSTVETFYEQCYKANDRPEFKSGEQGAEAQNEAIDQIRHVLKRFNDRLTLANLRLAERYLKAEIQLLVHFRIGQIDEEFGACLQREQCVVGPQKEIRERNTLGPLRPVGVSIDDPLHRRCYVNAAKLRRPYVDQQAMLIEY
jgi:hypothetical protein